MTGCNSKATPVSDSGEFREVVDRELNLDDGVATQQIKVDEHLALEIGNAVIKSVYGENAIKQTKFEVSELKDRDVYIVSRLPKAEQLGGDYEVAIRKTDGAILKVWAGE